MQPYQAENTERLERMIRSRIPPPPAPDPCPEPLRRILIKAMAPDPELRYQSAQEFAADLAAFRSGAPVAAVTRRSGRHAAHHASARRRRRRNAPHRPAIACRRMRRGRPGPRRRRRHRQRRQAHALGLRQDDARPWRFWRWPAFSTACGCVTSDYFLYQHGQQLAREIEAGTADRSRTRSGQNGRNFPRAILRLCYCTDRAKW